MDVGGAERARSDPVFMGGPNKSGHDGYMKYRERTHEF